MRKKVILICSDCYSRNYTTTKSETNTNTRLEFKKFCDKCNKYTIHKETK